MNFFNLTKLTIKPRVNERILLKKVVECRLRDSKASEVFKLNLELMAWHEFNRRKDANDFSCCNKVSYKTYCIAVLLRIVESYIISYQKKAV